MTDMPQRTRTADTDTSVANPARTTFEFAARTPAGTGTAVTPTTTPQTMQFPARTSAGTGTAVQTTSVSGWAMMKTTLDAASDFVKPLDIGAEPTVLKFLADAPFDALREHWLDELKGKKGFRCLSDSCPLCLRLGDRPARTKIHFAVVNFENPEYPVVAVLQTGAQLAKAIEKLATQDRRYQPDGLLSSKLYVAVSKSGTGKNTEYHLLDIKATDLEEDWGILPLTAEQFAEFQGQQQTDPIERVPTEAELHKLIDDLQSAHT